MYKQNEGAKAAAFQIIIYDATINFLTTSITWEEENRISASDILVLKQLQEKVLKASLFQTKK